MAANLQSFLGANPSAVFQSQIAGMYPQQRQFWGPRYSDVYGQYMGGQAQQAGMGQMPTGDFGSFLSKFPWLQQYYSYTPYQRGFRPSTFAPSTRMLSY